jgi:hypothetical protein
VSHACFAVRSRYNFLNISATLLGEEWYFMCKKPEKNENTLLEKL